MLLSQLSSFLETLLYVVGVLVGFGLLIGLGCLPIVVDCLSRRTGASFIPQRPLPESFPVGWTRGLLPDYVAWYLGRGYSVRRVEWEVADWLTALINARSSTNTGDQRFALVTFRHDFRTIISLAPIGGLIWCAASMNSELCALAVWLLSRCRDEAAVRAVKRRVDDPDPRVRREVARSFRRLAEWTELERMADCDQDVGVRALAKLLATTRRNHSQSLHRFVVHGGGEVYEPGRYTSHMPVFMLQPVGPGKPAKSRDWIRRILEHIRELVRSRFKNRAA